MTARDALLARSVSKFAALHNRQVIQVFDGFAAALAYCRDMFRDRLFSIREITSESLDMKWFSDALNPNYLRPSHRPGDY